MNTKLCKYCNKPIPRDRRKKTNVLYCSEECRREHYKREYHTLNKSPNLPASTVGTISVHRVVVDLLLRGYQVFQEVGLASCDLGILKGGRFLRVEVTTGRYIASGSFFAPYHDSARYDILATVLVDKIVYAPPLPI